MTQLYNLGVFSQTVSSQPVLCRDACTPKFIAVLFPVAILWNKTKCQKQRNGKGNSVYTGWCDLVLFFENFVLVYNVFCSHPPLLPSSSSPKTPLTKLPSNFMSSFFLSNYNPLSQISAVHNGII